MKVLIDIIELPDGKIRVRENSYAAGQYPSDEDSQFTDGAPMFSHSASVTLVERIDSSLSWSRAFIHDHSVTDVVNDFDVPGDGRYTVTQMVVPDMEWLEEAVGREYLDGMDEVFVTDGKKLYQYDRITGTVGEVDVDYVAAALNASDVNYRIKDTYRLFGLRKCYWAMCSAMLDAGCVSDTSCPDCGANGIYWLNLIFILLKTAAFLASKGRWDEADKILDAAGGKCSSLCGKFVNIGCGCDEPLPEQFDFSIGVTMDDMRRTTDFGISVLLED